MPLRRAEAEALKKVRALADKMTPEIQRQVAKALKAVNDGANLSAIEQALRTTDAFRLYDLAATLPAHFSAASMALESLFLKAANATALLLPGAARVGMRFDSANLAAQAAAKRYTFQLVRDVTQQTRQAIRTLVVRGFQDGISPRDLARLIKPTIGLTERQAVAVAKMHDRLIAEGVSRTAANARAKVVAEKLRRLRARTIARTEVIRASAQGQMAAWNEAVGKGLLGGTSQKVWITTPDDRLCRFCAPMNEKRTPLGTAFRTPLGRVDGPPLHPNCRCSVSVVPAQRVQRRAA